MKVCVQWTTRDLSDWVEYDSRLFHLAPRKPDPVPTDVVGNSPGWVHAIDCQGVYLNGHDHYAIESVAEDACRLTAWTPRLKQAVSILFKTLRPNEDGAWDTWQHFTYYSDPVRAQRTIGSGGESFRLRWDQFVPPPIELTRHGKLVTDAHNAAMETHRKRLRYDEDYLDGVPINEVSNGKLRLQAELGRRPPKQGTITYYLTDTVSATTVNSAITHECAMTTTGDGGTDTPLTSQNFTAGEDAEDYVWTTPTNEPNVASWPGSSTYLCTIRCTSVGGELSYGFGTADTAAGELARVNSALTTEESFVQQGQALFTGDGTKTGSQTWSPTGSVQSDRYQCLLAVTRVTGGHGNQTMVVNVNETGSFGEGPWTPPAAGGANLLSCLGAG